MNPPETETNLYARAGIDDLAEFYREKFVSNAVLDHRYFKPLDRFDLRFARTMWVYDNVRRNSTLLELGCGAGMLALLKRKGVALTGVDLSDECVAAARRNEYDETVRAELHHPRPGRRLHSHLHTLSAPDRRPHLRLPDDTCC